MPSCSSVMTLFLCGHRHNYSHLLERQPPDASAQQRQAEAYIEANAQRTVTLEELAEVTGVSAFSLFSSFKKSRGYSPMTFAARLRAPRGGFQ
jgi:transcriptional regulator GlxA family with amidase domain